MERYTVELIAGQSWIKDGERPMANCGISYIKKNQTDADLIAKALNHYTSLVGMQSIGEANGGKDE